jgi:hypothetical protein
VHVSEPPQAALGDRVGCHVGSPTPRPMRWNPAV